MGLLEQAGSWWAGVTTAAQGVAQPGGEYAVEAQATETPTQVVAQPSSVDTGVSHFDVDTRDESGAYEPISVDTSTPSVQRFTETVPSHVQEIERADYTKVEDLGDTKTQALLQQGYSPEQALAMQIDAAKAAGNVRAERYYRGEYDKALESNIALASEYHAEAKASGLPQAPNPFEYVGDISKSEIYRSAGVSNIPGTGLLPQYGESVLKGANIITKAERTGEMGIYGELGKPTSGERVLALAEQQAIGKAAAKTAGWEIDESRMEKFTPELITGAGFDLKYKEAAPSGVVGGLVSPGEYKPTIGFEQSNLFKPKGRGDYGVVSSERFSKGIDLVSTGKREAIDLTKVPGGDRSWADKQLSELSGGRLGTGETLGGFTMQSIGVQPLQRRGTAMAGVYRRSIITYPVLKRKHTSQKKTEMPHIRKPDPKIFNLESINKQIMPKKLGSDLFNFKLGAPGMLVKSISTKNLSDGIKINNIAENINLDGIGVRLPKNKSKVSGNIKKIMGESIKPIKIKMRK